MKNTQTKKGLLVMVLVAALLTVQVFADDATPYNWYCKNNDTHTQPVLDSGMAFVEEYDAYYVNRKAKDEKVIYLTFDAGYENGNVAKVLDVLKKHEATGAFFILENLIKRDGDLVKRMAEEGHLVCNHTATHPDMTKIRDEGLFMSQLTRLEKAYTDLTGQEMPKIYRPPQGRFSKANLATAKENGYKTLFWSFAYADWDNNKQPDPEASLQKILAHLHPGEVMLLHPTSATNAAILDRLLVEIKNEGYRIGSVEELWQ